MYGGGQQNYGQFNTSAPANNNFDFGGNNQQQHNMGNPFGTQQ